MSCDFKRTRLTDLFIKEQSGDVYETPTSADVVRLDAGAQIAAVPEAVERDILRSSFTPVSDLQGIKVATMGGTSELYGAGDYSDGTTKPWFNDLFRSVQLMETQVVGIPVSAIASDFVRGEEVTGGTGVGSVLIDTVDTDTVIYIKLTSGNFAAEAITGDIAGAATATGVEVDAGWSYKFDSSQCLRLSCRSEQDGQKSEIYNAIPTLSIEADDSGIPRINYEIAGVINIVDDIEQWLRDAAATTVTRDTQLPPLFQCGRLKYNEFSPVVDSTLTLDLQVERPERRDANSCAGIEGYVQTGRDPIASYRIDVPTNAQADIFQDWFRTNEVATEWRFGKEVGNTFWFFADTAKLQTVTGADENDIAKLELEFSLTGLDDDELEIIAI
jgi:hypothetical protein